MGKDKDRDACIAAMTELGLLYRGRVSDCEDFPKIRRVVRAYNERCDLLAKRPIVAQQQCGVCGEPQYRTPSGMTCANGHGGAPPIAPQ